MPVMMLSLEQLNADLDALVGRVVGGRYCLDALIGVGAMGAVFRGSHLGLQRAVAIKVLHPRLTADPRLCARFDREAHGASRLDHRNCVRTSDTGTTEDGIKFLVIPN